MLLVIMCVLSRVRLCNCSPPGSSVHGEFSRQEHWRGLPFHTPGDLPNPGIEPASPALAGGFFTIELPPCFVNIWHKMSLLKNLILSDFLSKFTWSFLHACSHGSQTYVLTNTNLRLRSMGFVNTTIGEGDGTPL